MDMSQHAARWNRVRLVEKRARGLRKDPCWDGDEAGVGPRTDPVGRASWDGST